MIDSDPQRDRLRCNQEPVEESPSIQALKDMLSKKVQCLKDLKSISEARNQSAKVSTLSL